MCKDKKRTRIQNTRKDFVKEQNRTNKDKPKTKYKRSKVDWTQKVGEEDESAI